MRFCLLMTFMVYEFVFILVVSLEYSRLIGDFQRGFLLCGALTISCSIERGQNVSVLCPLTRPIGSAAVPGSGPAGLHVYGQ